MTATEWGDSTDPDIMLKCVCEKVSDRTVTLQWSERKIRLYAVGCCRRIWHMLTDERSRNAVEAAESFADWSGVDLASVRNAADEAVWAAESWDSRKAARAAADSAIRRAKRAWEMLFGGEWAPEAWDPIDPVEACQYAGTVSRTAVQAVVFSTSEAMRDAALADEHVAQASLLRDIFGPLLFHPMPPIASTWLTWNDCTVKRLAKSAYEERSLPDGILDAKRLTILADALTDAGCADAALLDHLRGPGPHVRGCWVVDLLLGKS